MIQQATLNNLAQLDYLVNRAYRGEVSRKGWTTEADLLDGLRIIPEALAQLITDTHSLILIYRDDQEMIRGCVNLQIRGNKLYLGLLSVDPEYQSRGIGKLLLAAADDYALEKGISAIIMSVISVRTELIAWYKKYGFEDTGETAPFPPAHPDSGIPRRPLEFIILEKKITPRAT